MDVISNVIAAVAAAGAFVTAYGALKLKVLDRLQAERLDIEKEKTAKERYYRELAEGEIQRLLKIQNLVADHLEDSAKRLQKIDHKIDEYEKNLEASGELRKHVNKIAHDIEEHCGIKVPRPE